MVCFFTVAVSRANLTLLAGDIISGNYHDSYLPKSDAISWYSLEATELEEEQTLLRTPFEECLTEISHVITCLYKFSITTQNPTPRDRFEKCAAIDMSHFKHFDISHIMEKFP